MALNCSRFSWVLAWIMPAMGCKLRGDAPQIASDKDGENDLDRSAGQLLSFPGHSGVGSPESCPDFRVIRVSAHNARHARVP